MKRTIISAIVLGVFLLADGVSAEAATPAQDPAAAAGLDSSRPEQARYGNSFWCWDPYWGWYYC